MPPKKISDPGFRGGDELSHEQWRALETTNSADSPRRLLKTWTETVVGFLCCHLANDCLSIDQMIFSLSGRLFSDSDGLQLNASKFWEVNDHLTFEIPAFDSSIFTFRGGTLTSELLDHSQLRVAWYQDGEPLSPEEREDAGIPGFCLRFYATPNAATWFSISIILYPLPRAALLDTFPCSVNPAFPGLRLYSANHCYLGFPTKQLFPSLNAGSPIMPCILANGEWEDNPTNPSTQDLITAMAKTLRTATSPVAKKNLKNLIERWQEIQSANDVSLKLVPPTYLWPLPSEPPSLTPQGRSSTAFFLAPPPPPFPYPFPP